MTTCKRLSLFIQTLESVYRCIEDLDEHVGRILVIDDNSSESDRNIMKAAFPHVEFMFKTHAQRGHARSMNLIMKNVDTRYILHIEDDWEFTVRAPFIGYMFSVLEREPQCLQVLFNANYSERELIHGGELVDGDTQRPYIRHVHHTHPLPYANCAYWPHFSLRPGLWDMQRMRSTVGMFDPRASHFELEYAHRYVAAGFITCFLPGMCSVHTGKLTSEHTSVKPNAYALNGEPQFTNDRANPPPLDTLMWRVLNLDRRPDRLERFLGETRRVTAVIERVAATDGLAGITPAEEALFRVGDYKMRAGIVGCARSHMRLWEELVASASCPCMAIFEDDYTLPEHPDLETVVTGLLANPSWDVVFLTHHVKVPFFHSGDVHVVSARESFTHSYGGTCAYLIRKDAAVKLLAFVRSVGMLNAIDTMIQRAADIIRVGYLSLPFGSSPMANGDPTVDSDIQV